MGVDWFFVISGYLIGTILLSEYCKSARIEVLRFCVRCFMRLTPVYAVVMTSSNSRPCARGRYRQCGGSPSGGSERNRSACEIRPYPGRGQSLKRRSTVQYTPKHAINADAGRTMRDRYHTRLA